MSGPNPTDSEMAVALSVVEGPGTVVANVARALAAQRARYEAVAAGQEASSARWMESFKEADNDMDHSYAWGRAHAAEQAALRIREVARG